PHPPAWNCTAWPRPVRGDGCDGRRQPAGRRGPAAARAGPASGDVPATVPPERHRWRRIRLVATSGVSHDVAGTGDEPAATTLNASRAAASVASITASLCALDRKPAS